MEIKIKAIHFDASEKLEAFVEKKVSKLQKAYDEIKTAEISMNVTKPATALNKEVKLNVSGSGMNLFVEKTCDTFEEAIDLCVESMRTQITKFKEKQRGH